LNCILVFLGGIGVGVGDHIGVEDGVGDRIGVEDGVGDCMGRAGAEGRIGVDPSGDRIVRMDRMGVDPSGDRIVRMDRMGVDPSGDRIGDRTDLIGVDPGGDRIVRMDLMGVDLDGDGLRDLGDPLHLTMGGIVYTEYIIFHVLRIIVCIFVAGFRLSFLKVIVKYFLVFVPVPPRLYLVYMRLYFPYGGKK